MSVTAEGRTGRRPMSSRWKATSSEPSGGRAPSIFSSASASASAKVTPPVCSPISTTWSGPWLRSRISCAIRHTARRTSSASSTWVRAWKTPPNGGVLRRSRSANRGPPRVLSVRVSQDPLHGQTGTLAALPAWHAHPRAVVKAGPTRRRHRLSPGGGSRPRRPPGPRPRCPGRSGPTPAATPAAGPGPRPPPGRPRPAATPRPRASGASHHPISARRTATSNPRNPTSPHTVSSSRGLMTRSSARPRTRRSDSPTIQRRAPPATDRTGTGFAPTTDGSRQAATRAATSAGSSRHPRSRMP